jgi:tRNA A37 N6-isopentenylltransferase MiaA
MSAYKFRDSFRAPAGVTAEAAAKEMERVRQETGSLTPKALVDASRPKDAPLHSAFEWSDKKAAEAYRQHQASTLIRAVEVRYETDEAASHRQWVLAKSEESAEKPSYLPATEVVQRVDLFADAIARLTREVTSAQRAVHELEALAKHAGAEPERMARIALAAKALETASNAVAALN